MRVSRGADAHAPPAAERGGDARRARGEIFSSIWLHHASQLSMVNTSELPMRCAAAAMQNFSMLSRPSRTFQHTHAAAAIRQEFLLAMMPQAAGPRTRRAQAALLTAASLSRPPRCRSRASVGRISHFTLNITFLAAFLRADEPGARLLFADVV